MTTGGRAYLPVVVYRWVLSIFLLFFVSVKLDVKDYVLDKRSQTRTFLSAAAFASQRPSGENVRA